MTMTLQSPIPLTRLHFSHLLLVPEEGRREKTVVLKVRNAYQPVDVTYFAYRRDGLDTRRRSLGLEISADEARRVMERTS